MLVLFHVSFKIFTMQIYCVNTYMQQYFCAVMDDLGPERSDRLYNDIVALVEALERRNDLAMGNAGSGKPDPENGREIHT